MKNVLIAARHRCFGGKASALNLGMLLLLITSAGLLGCGSDEEPKDPKDPDGECINSDHAEYRTVLEGAETREYILHVPSSYDSNIPTSLVLNFHGFGDCAADYADNVGDDNGLNSLANSENFLVAYPQGIIREKGSPEWDPGDNGSRKINENDIYFVEQLISDISNLFNVDSLRVYATGYSNGGMMAYGLACSKSELIAAVGIMSGIMLDDDACDVNEFTSVIHFHGSGDDVISYDGIGDYQSVSEVMDFWLNHNGIPSSNLVSTQLNGGDVVRDEYMGGNEDVAVVLYTVNSEAGKEGGHVWFSDDIDGRSPNKILWDFLSSFSL